MGYKCSGNYILDKPKSVSDNTGMSSGQIFLLVGMVASAALTIAVLGWLIGSVAVVAILLYVFFKTRRRHV